MKLASFQTLSICLLMYTSCTKKGIDSSDFNPEVGEQKFATSIASVQFLPIENFVGNYQNIHPKVLHFPNEFNGYKYWMAYTPYPNGNTKYENACIAVSQDGIAWKTPFGLTNPIKPQFKDGYNSDTHLLYREDLKQLELWYRPFSTLTLKNKIVRVISKDGITWSKEEVILDFDDSQKLSPAVIYEDSRYKLWYCDQGVMKYTESLSENPIVWGEHITLPIKTHGLKLWHHDVIHTPNVGYEFLICAHSPEGNNNTADLHYTRQINGQFSPLRPVFKRNSSNFKEHQRAIYRSSLLKQKNSYYIYLSCIDNDWNRHLLLLKTDSTFTID